MSRDNQHNPDPNITAARVVKEATGEDKPLPADLEAAWAEWSKSVQKVDERGMSLLRAAFRAGYEAGYSGGAANLGRAGGLKGGKARADKLTSGQRSDIARRAAEARWARDRGDRG